MENASVDDLDAQCVLALILGAIRADRFYSGIFLHFLKCGAILRWLERLEEIDAEEWDKSFMIFECINIELREISFSVCNTISEWVSGR